MVSNKALKLSGRAADLLPDSFTSTLLTANCSLLCSLLSPVTCGFLFSIYTAKMLQAFIVYPVLLWWILTAEPCKSHQLLLLDSCLHEAERTTLVQGCERGLALLLLTWDRPMDSCSQTPLWCWYLPEPKEISGSLEKHVVEQTGMRISGLLQFLIFFLSKGWNTKYNFDREKKKIHFKNWRSPIASSSRCPCSLQGLGQDDL